MPRLYVAGVRGEKAGTALDPELSYGIAEKYHAGTVDGSRRKLVVRFLVESEVNPVGLSAHYFAIGLRTQLRQTPPLPKVYISVFSYVFGETQPPNHLTT